MDRSPIATGIAKVDDLLNGGIQRGRVTLLTSQFTMMGKTSLAVTIAYNAARLNQKVVFLTLEGAERDVTSKILAMQSGVSVLAIHRATVKGKEIEKVMRAGRDFQSDHLYVSDYLQKNAQTVRRSIGDIKADLVIIDYLDLMRVDSDNYSQVLANLQDLAQEKNAAFLVVTPLHAGWRPIVVQGKQCPLLLLSRQDSQAQLTAIQDGAIAQSYLHFHEKTTRFFGDSGEVAEVYPEDEESVDE